MASENLVVASDISTITIRSCGSVSFPCCFFCTIPVSVSFWCLTRHMLPPGSLLVVA